jgi:hypothetical protein
VCSQCEEGLGPITTMGRDATEATVGLLSKLYSFNYNELKKKLKDVVFFVIYLSSFQQMLPSVSNSQLVCRGQSRIVCTVRKSIMARFICENH